MRQAGRIFRLDPAPPKVENINDYIVSAARENDLTYFTYFLHHYEPSKLSALETKFAHYLYPIAFAVFCVRNRKTGKNGCICNKLCGSLLESVRKMALKPPVQNAAKAWKYWLFSPLGIAWDS